MMLTVVHFIKSRVTSKQQDVASNFIAQEAILANHAILFWQGVVVLPIYHGN